MSLKVGGNGPLPTPGAASAWGRCAPWDVEKLRIDSKWSHFGDKYEKMMAVGKLFLFFVGVFCVKSVNHSR